MSILLGVVLLFAVLCAAIAAAQAVAINRVAPNTPWRGWLLGWWRFGEITERAGSSGAAQATLYKRAAIACLVFVVFGLVLNGWATSQRPSGTAFSSMNLDNWLIETASADAPSFRPVAPMPGATSLES